MRKLLARLTRMLGLIEFDLIAVTRPIHPDTVTLQHDEMIIVGDTKIRKWACLQCPGGCGSPISLSLNPDRRPRWTVLTDFWHRPTVSPSVHQLNACGCHFWIKSGRVEWCLNGRPCRTNSGMGVRPRKDRAADS